MNRDPGTSARGQDRKCFIPVYLCLSPVKQVLRNSLFVKYIKEQSMPSPESIAIRARFAKFPADADPLQARRDWEAQAANTPLPAGTQVTPVDMAGLYGEWVDAPGAEPQRVVLFLHGGGYNAGAPITHRELSFHISAAAGARVLLPAYRLAPENPFPAAV